MGCQRWTGLVLHSSSSGVKAADDARGEPSDRQCALRRRRRSFSSSALVSLCQEMRREERRHADGEEKKNNMQILLAQNQCKQTFCNTENSIILRWLYFFSPPLRRLNLPFWIFKIMCCGPWCFFFKHCSLDTDHRSDKKKLAKQGLGSSGWAPHALQTTKKNRQNCHKNKISAPISVVQHRRAGIATQRALRSHPFKSSAIQNHGHIITKHL